MTLPRAPSTPGFPLSDALVGRGVKGPMLPIGTRLSPTTLQTTKLKNNSPRDVTPTKKRNKNESVGLVLMTSSKNKWAPRLFMNTKSWHKSTQTSTLRVTMVTPSRISRQCKHCIKNYCQHLIGSNTVIQHRPHEKKYISLLHHTKSVIYLPTTLEK